ncbi:Choline transporter-like protein 4 [Oopsacas minuta]|uniref:Choline transporter-like protein n=1 Tax=Oopsacas minuta TaxID=111878 RepID=A0AAV7KAT8_9METZ|nr:Choline transporter-like protein 4 [Oopsacas minuta]
MCDCCTTKERKENVGEKLKYDPKFTGPVRWSKRVPTDVLCILLFCFFWVGMIVIAFYSFVEGTPSRLLHPVDSRGRLCGVDAGVEDKPLLFFFDLTSCANIYRTVINSGITNLSLDTSNLFSCPTPQVCVSSCPNETITGITNNPICVDEVDTTQFQGISLEGLTDITTIPAAGDLLQEIVAGRCAPYYVLSTNIADRCIPTFVSVETATGTFLDFNSTVDQYQLNSSISIQDIQDGTLAIALIVNFRQFLIDIYRDLTIVWPYLLGGLLLSALVPFLYIVLMRWLAWVIVIAGIIFTYLVLAGITGFSFYQFWRFETNANDTNVVSNAFSAAFQQLLPWWRYQRETWLALGIIFAVVFLILTLLLIFLIPRIILAIKIIVQASRAVSSLWSSLFYPFITWILLGVIAIYYIVIAVFLVTATEKQFSIVTNDTIPALYRTFINQAGNNFTYENGSLCDIDQFTELNANSITNDTRLITFINDQNQNVTATLSCTFLQFFTSNLLIFAQFYHLFGLFWTANYIVALGECALAGGFAVWYWSPVVKGNRRTPWFPVQKSSLVAFIYHSGSLAFGALIIAIIQLIRAILAYAQRQLKKHKELKVIQYVLCALGCLFFILEKILRYVNRMAYIEIAIYGYGFCRGAYHAVTLLLRNVVRAAVKDRVAHFILFLGKLACVGLVAVVSYLFFGEYNETLGASLWGRPLNFYLVPIIILVFATYLIASGFLDTYGMAIDTLFICVLEDMERNDGSAGKEYRFDSKLKNAYVEEGKEKGELEEPSEEKKKKK